MSVTLRPYLVGDGPVTFSTCLELDRVRVIVWDTNCYYRHLGVRTDATRREIRQAYQRLGGHASARLTYVVKQLLDPQVRAKYDATPLGSLFFDDEVEGWMRAARVQESVRLRREGRIAEAEALEAEPVEAVLDTEDDGDEDGAAQPLEVVWPWAFYLYGSECQDRGRLRQWQELLASALGSRKQHLQLAIGFSGGMASPWGVQTVGYRLVVFLHDGEQPTEALAQAAASRVVNTIRSPHGAPSMEINKSWQTSARAQTPPRRHPRAAATSPAPTSSASRMARSTSSGS